MRAQWWSCMLGLLCIPAGVILGTGTVSQHPMSISFTRVNSSAEITCSTPTPGAIGFSLHRYFKGNKQIAYLNLENGVDTKRTIAPEFKSRLRVVPTPQIREGHGFSLQISLLGLEDTDMYYCSWSYLPSKTPEPPHQSGKGTIIIIRERDPGKQCKQPILDYIFIVLSVAAFAIMLSFVIGVAIVKCNRFKGEFRPDRHEATNRPTRPDVPPQPVEPCPYLTTSRTSYQRGVLQP
ncbi:uncharacterized protein LOC117830175 [Notolabrus celidotus]|uniref:uncharacterized protein LOC117830175 n=1 Tax=Notolabrus celidotus TaxID=1203425 RepID=UPI00148F4EAC|nr:uncharacterized protein LOC117830175 [Notolabrus celidotus]